MICFVNDLGGGIEVCLKSSLWETGIQRPREQSAIRFQ